MWNNYKKVKPPKQVVFTADFGDYTDKCIIDYKNRLWSDTEHLFITEEPNRWKI